MFARLRRALQAREDDGASAVEYALLVAAIAALIIVVVFAFGNLIRGIFENTCNDLQAHSSSTSSDCGKGSTGG
jgi:pilus assembly protein Flp/PilA